MKKTEKQLLTVGVIGAGALGVIALARPQWLKSIGLSRRTAPLAVTGASDTVRIYILGIPNERYLLTATTNGGMMQPVQLATNKPVKVGPYGSLSFDLQVPAPPTTAHIQVIEMKTGRKMVQDVYVDPTQVQQQVYFGFNTEQGRMR